MALLIIERTNEYNNRFRKFRVYIDGKEAGQISNGEIKKFEVEKGSHTVCCKIDWCSSPELSVDVTDPLGANLKVGGLKSGNRIFPIALFTFLFIPFLKRLNPDFKYLYYLFIPIGGMLIYFLTFGRKKYLTLKEI